MVHTDYSADALANITWSSDYGIDDTDGSTIFQQNSYLSEPFRVQDCIYLLKSTDTSISLIELHIYAGFSEDEEYYGYFKTSSTTDTLYQMTKLQLNPDYYYRVVVKTSNTFNSSAISCLPVDNRETAVPSFSIPLWEYVDNFGVTDGGNIINNHINGELNITSIFEEHNIPITNYGPYINKIYGVLAAKVKGTSTSSGAGVNTPTVGTKN